MNEQRRIVAYLDSVQARLVALRELQSQTQEELDALLPSVLDKAFRESPKMIHQVQSNDPQPFYEV